MQRRQLEELLRRWELPNSFSGVSAAVSQLLESGLYFQGYCLIKEETISERLPNCRHETVEFKKPGWGRAIGLSTKCSHLRHLHS